MKKFCITLLAAAIAGSLQLSGAWADTLPPAADRQLARDMLKTLVEIDTTHAHGSTEAAKAIQSWALTAGFAPADVVLIAPEDHPTKGNVIVRYRGKHAGKAVAINLDGGGGVLKGGAPLYFEIGTSEKTYVTYTLETTSPGGHGSLPGPDNASTFRHCWWPPSTIPPFRSRSTHHPSSARNPRRHRRFLAKSRPRLTPCGLGSPSFPAWRRGSAMIDGPATPAFPVMTSTASGSMPMKTARTAGTSA